MSEDARVSYVVLASAGSAGGPFAAVAEQLDALLLTMPDADDVHAMADELCAAMEAVPRPRVLVGASLGAMVALECARAGAADGLVLIAAGFGIAVGEGVLEWVAANPPDMLAKTARIGLADPENTAQVAARLKDFETRGQPVLLASPAGAGGLPPGTAAGSAAHARAVGRARQRRAARRSRRARHAVPRRAGPDRGCRPRALPRAAGGDGSLGQVARARLT